MYRKILVPIDGSTTSQGGLREAIKLAKNQGAQLRLFHMVSDPVFDCGYASGALGGELIASAHEAGRAIVSEALAITRHEGLEPETESVVREAPVPVLLVHDLSPSADTVRSKDSVEASGDVVYA